MLGNTFLHLTKQMNIVFNYVTVNLWKYSKRLSCVIKEEALNRASVVQTVLQIKQLFLL